MSNTSNETHGYQADIECGVEMYLQWTWTSSSPNTTDVYRWHSSTTNTNTARSTSNPRTSERSSLSATWQALPAFIVRYGHSKQDGWWGEVPDDSTPWFQVIPLNAYAHGAGLPSNDNNTKLSELVFVSWLYELRGRKIPQDIVNIITKQ
jgi:hypothetical protein